MAYFTEQDKTDMIKALNFIAENADFNSMGRMDIKTAIDIRNHFANLQGMVKKVEDNILEGGKVKQYNNSDNTNNGDVSDK